MGITAKFSEFFSAYACTRSHQLTLWLSMLIITFLSLWNVILDYFWILWTILIIQWFDVANQALCACLSCAFYHWTVLPTQLPKSGSLQYIARTLDHCPPIHHQWTTNRQFGILCSTDELISLEFLPYPSGTPDYCWASWPLWVLLPCWLHSMG